MSTTFRIEVSELVIRRDYNSLSEEEKKVLCKNTTFDSQLHEIFTFTIAPFEVDKPEYSARTRRRKDLKKVDNCLVDLTMGSPVIQILGVNPGTIQIDKRPWINMEEVELLLDILGKKIHLKALYKPAVKAKTHAVIARYVTPKAQWAFLKPYVEENADLQLNLSFLCLVPKDLEPENRYILSSARFRQGTLNLEGVDQIKLRIP